MEQDLKFNMNHVSVNVDWMKVYVIQTKIGILVKVGVSAKNWIIGVIVKMIICGILAVVILGVTSHVKPTNI